MTGMTRLTHIPTAGGMVPMAGLADALKAARGGGYLWLDLLEPTRDDLMTLVGPLGVHPLSVEDALDDDQVPKIEDFPGYTFILFNAFTHHDGSLVVGEVDIFVGQNFLVTVSRPGPDGKHLLEGVQRHAERDMEMVRQGPAFLLHVVLDEVVDNKFLAVEALEDRLNEGEETIMEDVARFDPSELLRLRRELLAVRKSLFHEREILIRICRKDCPIIPENAIYAFRDIYDHLARGFELTESYRDIVTSLREMHLAMLNNRMTLAANETNRTVRRLTFITTIFMPLTLLAGVGGMSEWSMMTGPENWPIAYPAFLLGMLVLGLISYRILKRLENPPPRKEDKDPP
jgi:magnesium transporter